MEVLNPDDYEDLNPEEYEDAPEVETAELNPDDYEDLNPDEYEDNTPSLFEEVAEATTTGKSPMSQAMKGETAEGTPMEQAMNKDGFEPLSQELKPENIGYTGNIDIDNREVLKEGDSYKTENSITIGVTVGDEDKQVIIPTVVDGKQLEEKEAIDHFFKSKQHLGMYDTIEEADAQAEKIHLRQQEAYKRGSMRGYDRDFREELFKGEGKEWENPDADNWDLPKRVSDVVNDLVTGSIKGSYRFMGEAFGGILEPLEVIGSGSKDKSQAVRDWFTDAGVKLTKELEDTKYDVKPTHSPKTIKQAYKASGLFDIDTLQEILMYGGETGVESLPYTLAMSNPYSMSAVGVAMVENGAQERAENDGRKKATTQDVLEVTPTVLASLLLEKFGFDKAIKEPLEEAIKEGGLKQASKLIVKSMGAEGITETLQQPIEKFGEEVGTKKGLSSPEEYAEEAFWAGLAGSISGGGMTATTITGAQIYRDLTIEGKMKKARDKAMTDWASQFTFTDASPQQQKAKEQLDAFKEEMKGFTFSELSPQEQQQLIDKKKWLDGLVFSTLSPEQQAQAQEEANRIENVQETFNALVEQHPEVEFPAEIVADIDMQEQVLIEYQKQQDEETGLNESEQYELNHLNEKTADELTEEEVWRKEDLEAKEQGDTVSEPKETEEIKEQAKPEETQKEETKEPVGENLQIGENEILPLDRGYTQAELDAMTQDERIALNKRMREHREANKEAVKDLEGFDGHGKKDGRFIVKVHPNQEGMDKDLVRVVDSSGTLHNAKKDLVPKELLAQEETKEPTPEEVKEKHSTVIENASMLAWKRKKQRDAKKKLEEIPGSDYVGEVQPIPDQESYDREEAHLNRLEQDTLPKVREEQTRKDLTEAIRVRRERLKEFRDNQPIKDEDEYYKEHEEVNKLRHTMWGNKKPSTKAKQHAEVQRRQKRLEEFKPTKMTNGKNLYDNDSPDLQADNIGTYEVGKRYNYTDSTPSKNTRPVVVTGKGDARGFVNVTSAYDTDDLNNLHSFGVRPKTLSYIEDEVKETPPKEEAPKDEVITENNAHTFPEGEQLIFWKNKLAEEKSKYVMDANKRRRYENAIWELENPEIKDDIIEEERIDNDRTTTGSGTSNETSDKPRVSDEKQSVPVGQTEKGDTEQVPKGDKRPPESPNDRSTQDEVSPEDSGVGGLPTIDEAKPIEQQPLDADGVLPERDDGQPYGLEGRAPVELTKGQRKKFNAQAQEILKKPVDEITDADREILRHYTGEGGLGEVNENTVNQHYTSYETVESIYKALNDTGVPMTKSLEPAVGSGNFVGFNPAVNWDVVDIDTTNIEITKRIYPQIKSWSAESYETFKGKNYDLIISNVPFASEQMLMREHAMTILPAFKAIHNFYFAHSMGKLKDNGVMAFMTSTGTMDGTTKARNLRSYLMDRGDILGAFRLPEKSQAKNAHTDTMIDIIIIQKRPSGVESRQSDLNNQFINIGNKDGYPMNEYFIAHPENVLGEQVVDKDKTKMGKVGWIAKGTPNFSNIKINYEPYEKLKKDKEERSNFVGLEEAREYAKKNGLVFKTTNEMKTHLDIKSDAIILFDTPVTFQETDQKAMMGKVNKGINAKKALHLNRIMTLTEDAVKTEDKGMLSVAVAEIQSYKETYEKAPHIDKPLQKFMATNNAGLQLKEYMSYFDQLFTPAPIYNEKTRFKDSGKLEINEKSPLEDRALFYADGESVIDTSKSYPYLSVKDIDALVKSRKFVKSDTGKIQLSFMYYSGNVYDKIDRLNAMYGLDRVTGDEFKEQGDKLESLIPEQIPLVKIKIRGNESWLPTQIKEAILFTTGKGDMQVRGGILKNGLHQTIYNNYLAHKALAKKDKDETEQENMERTKLFQEILQDEILPTIKTYIEGKGLATLLVEEYNRNANFYVRPKMTGVLLRNLPKSFRGNAFNMQSHQAEGAEKVVFNKKGVIAFAPGGGKTITAIVAVKQLLDQGVMKKPLFVVPVNTIAQWEESVKELYPDAKVFEFPKIKSGKNKGNAKEWAQLTKEDKEQMVFDLANTRYDFTIVGDTMFQKIGLPQDILDEYVDDLVEEISSEEEAQETDDNKKKKKGVSNEAKKKALKNGLKMAYESSSDFDFAKLGFDGVIADEVQYYKNIGMQGKDTEGGLGATIAITYKDKAGKTLKAKEIEEGAEPHSATLGSFRSYDFRFKTKYVSQNNNGNNVILLTGTPTPNKPLELMTLLQHLDSNILKEYGIETATDFVDTFYETAEEEVLDTLGKPVKKKGLSGMKNQDFLRNILDRFIDYKGFKDMPDLPRPKQIDKQHYLELGEAGKAIFKDVQHRIVTAMNDAKLVKQGAISSEFIEIPLVGMGAGRSASIDLRLYDVGSKEKSLYTQEEINELVESEVQTEQNNKILKTISLVSDQYQSNSNSGQIVFLDRLTIKNPDGTETSTHAEMREQFLETGLFKDSEVVFVNGAGWTDPVTGVNKKGSIKPAKLNEIMDAYNAGDIKVIIGNTSKLGVGVDLNRKTTDIYQLDIPYRPDEIEQRSNRGVRQGNENPEVRVHQFFQIGTFDKRSYDIVIAKRGFNDVYRFSNNDDVVINEDGTVNIDRSDMADPYQAIIDLETDPFKRERLRQQRLLDNSAQNITNLSNVIIKLISDSGTKQKTIGNYTQAIESKKKELDPSKYPAYKDIKDPKEKQKKIDAYVKRINDQIKKYQNSINEAHEEVGKIEKQLEVRKEQEQQLKADIDFAREEFTQDGENVELSMIKDNFTEESILRSEGAWVEPVAQEDYHGTRKEGDLMRPAFINLVDVVIAPSRGLTKLASAIDKVLSDNLTGKVKNTKLDNFIRRRLGGSKSGLGMLTRSQEADFVKHYRVMQSAFAKSNISATQASDLIDSHFVNMDMAFLNRVLGNASVLGHKRMTPAQMANANKKMKREIYNAIVVRYLENPNARDEIADIMPDLANELDMVRDYIDDISREAMSRGILLPSQFNRWKDKYLSRLYLIQNPKIEGAISAEKGIKMATVKSGRKIESIVDYIYENPAKAKELGVILDPNLMVKMTIAKTQGNIAIEDFFRGITERSNLISAGSLVTLDEPIANLPIQFSPTYAVNTAIPYIKDMIKTINRAIEDGKFDAVTNATLVERNKEYKKTIKEIKRKARVADAYLKAYDTKKFALVPEDKRYGAIAGLPLTKDVVSLVKAQFNIVNNPEMFSDGLDNAMSIALAYFKWAKVPANVFSYARNLQSNLFQWTMSGADPVTFLPEYGRAIASMITKDEWYQIAKAEGLIDDNQMTFEVNNALRIIAQGVKEDSFLAGTKKGTLKAMQLVGDAYGVIDDIAKIARLRYAVETDGLTAQEGASIAQDTHYDYGLTYDFIRNIRNPDISTGTAGKLMLTLFPTYTVKTIAFTYDTLIERPATLALMGMGIYMLVASMGAGDDDNIERIGRDEWELLQSSLPEWIANNPMIRIYAEKINGEIYVTFTDLSHNIPQGSLSASAYSLVKGDVASALGELGAGGSPLQLVGNLVVNKDSFTKRDIYYEHEGKQKAKDIAWYMAKQAMPGTISKIISLNTTRHDKLPRYFGINTYTYTLKQMERSQEFRATDAKRDATSRARVYRNAIKNAKKDLDAGKISEEKYLDIKKDNTEEIQYWKDLGEDTYDELSSKSPEVKKYERVAREVRSDFKEVNKLRRMGQKNDQAFREYKKYQEENPEVGQKKKIVNRVASLMKDLNEKKKKAMYGKMSEKKRQGILDTIKERQKDLYIKAYHKLKGD